MSDFEVDRIPLSEEVVFVLFVMEELPICQDMERAVEEVMPDYAPAVLRRVTTEDRETCARHGVISFPTLDIVHQGRVIRRLGGTYSPALIRDELEDLFNLKLSIPRQPPPEATVQPDGEDSAGRPGVGDGRRRRLRIDDAPGKELIPLVHNHGDLDAFAEFYRLRRDWWRYPLVHDRFVTYGIFEDLTDGLDRQAQAVLLPEAVALAENESDQLFLCAIFLILNLIGGFSASGNRDDIWLRIKAMHQRAKKLSLFPNMSCFWNQIVNRILRGDTDGAILVDSNDWRECISLDFPLVDEFGWQNCPGGEDMVRKEIRGIRGGDFVLEYIRSALYEGSKYWIWLYRNVSEHPIWHWYVYIVTNPDGETELHRHSMHTVVTIPPEELVVKHAYGVLN